LNVGLDMNIDNKTKTFYSVNGGANWYNSSYSGSVMIRPIFSTEMDKELGVKETALAVNHPWKVYPNPTNGQLNLKNEAMHQVDWILFDLYGKEIQKGNEFEIQLDIY